MGFDYGGAAGRAVRPFSPVGNAVPGVPTAEGGDLVRFAGALHLRNAGDGVPYGSDFDAVCAKKPPAKVAGGFACYIISYATRNPMAATRKTAPAIR